MDDANLGVVHRRRWRIVVLEDERAGPSPAGDRNHRVLLVELEQWVRIALVKNVIASRLPNDDLTIAVAHVLVDRRHSIAHVLADNGRIQRSVDAES